MTALLAGNERFAPRRKVSEVAQVARRSRAFGEQKVQSGSSANRFTFVGKNGHYRQPDLGNYWLRARVYRDGSGRFLIGGCARGRSANACLRCRARCGEL
jgi:hypothetical protein